MFLQSETVLLVFRVRSYSFSDAEWAKRLRRCRCENEFRECFGRDGLDTEIQSLADDWHSRCDDHLSYSVTTPAVTARTIDQQYCDGLVTSCKSYNYGFSQCSISYTDIRDRLSCECQPSMLSLESECQYNMNISCFLTTADMSNLHISAQCPSFVTASTTVRHTVHCRYFCSS